MLGRCFPQAVASTTTSQVIESTPSQASGCCSIPIAHSVTAVHAVAATDFPLGDFPIRERVLRSRAQLERTTFEKQTCELGIKPTIRLLAACA